jgi:nucleoside 2-deoxyribosyltransferase
MTSTARRPRVYLAGPEVFLRNAAEIGAIKVALCRDAGLEGLFPLDQTLDVAGLAPLAQAAAIAVANEDLMRSAAAIIANMTPFRGVSMDAGTAYEVGFMRALRRPVFGYTSSPGDYRARVERFRRDAPPWSDGESTCSLVEDFGMAENLMIDCAVRAHGTEPFRGTAPGHDIADPDIADPDIADLEPFRRCLAAAAALLHAAD